MNRIGVYRKKTDIGGFVRAPEKTDFARAAILLIARLCVFCGGMRRRSGIFVHTGSCGRCVFVGRKYGTIPCGGIYAVDL